MKINNEMVLGVIAELEQRLPVDQYELFGIKVWPYIRTSLKFKFDSYAAVAAKSQRPDFSKPARYSRVQLLKTLFQCATRFPLLSLLRSRKTDVVFLSPTYFNLELEGEYVDRITVGIEKRLQEEGVKCAYLKYEVFSAKQSPFGSDITSLTYGLNELCRYFISRQRDKVPSIAFVDDINDQLRAMGSPVILEHHKVFFEFKRLIWLARSFSTILFFFHAKRVIIPVYYNYVGLAMCLACKWRGTESIEYQHGAQSRFHVTYNDWNTIPSNGYELLPDTFWVWGETNRQRIERWAKRQGADVFVTGNAWLDYQQKMLNLPSQPPPLKAAKQQGKRVAVLCLQRFPEHYKSFVSDAIFASDGWLWVVKEHPAYPLDKDSTERFFGQGIQQDKVIIERSVDTYTLLRYANVCVTAFSSVAFESEYYGVPSILFHRDGYEGHSDYIDREAGIRRATNVDELLDNLHKLDGYKPGKNTYIRGFFALPQ
ncbi:hypothetical protein [Aestuariibacter salexigens]|uniref:hypothetical protein n=1 Tax=Aestuariibacter salexigens TaxID=226010 RepID=UPI00047E65B8|nr:hypothetical protein [Aestuariibacter salexigens]